LRPERRRQGADTLDQLVDIEAHRITVSGNALLDAVLDLCRQAIEVQQCLGMHADHAVDDEFQARQTHTLVGQVGEIESAVRVANVHHDLERQFGHGINAVGTHVELQTTVVDNAGIAFCARHGYDLTILEFAGGIAAAHYRRDTQLTSDDGCVTGAAAAVGDDGAGALHHRLPVWIGHVGDQYVAGLDLVHFRYVANHLDRARADALADGPPIDQDGTLVLQKITFHDVDIAAAFHGFRPSLDDIQLAVIPILGPFDVHRAAVVLLDDHRLTGQADHFLVAQAEARTLSGIHFDGLDRAASSSLFTVDHLDRLAAQIATQNGRTTGLQRGLVDIELVRVNRALHHGLTQAVGTGDEHHITEAGFGIQGKHYTGGTGLGADHALHAGGQGDQLVIEALVHAVGYGAVVEQRGKHFLGGADDVVRPPNVQEGFLLTGKGGIRQVFGGSGGAYGDGEIVIAGSQLGESLANCL